MFSPKTLLLGQIFAVVASGAPQYVKLLADDMMDSSIEHQFQLLIIGLAECPDGYEGHVNYCYKLLPVKATWAEALVCSILSSDISLKRRSNDIPHNRSGQEWNEIIIPNTDPGCPAGYEAHDDWCYKLLHVQGTWAEAQRYCEAVGGDLAVITDDIENTFIENMLTRIHAEIGTSQVWIGGSDLLQEGTFLAPKTLEPLTYTKWAPGEPDNIGDHGQHCIALFNSAPLYLWDDATCENKYNPLCKRSKSSGNSEIIG